jgi:hypothetical protein
MSLCVVSRNCTGRNIFCLLAILAIFCFCFFQQRALAQDYFNKEFAWSYNGYQWTWSLSIPKSLYDSYKRVSLSDRTRYGTGGYDYLVSTKDSFVKQVANKLHEAASQKGYGAYETVSFMLAFVQSLPYTSDYVTKGFDEYPRFPIETLVDDGGDCEDTSILFATLVLIEGYGTVFISPPSHVAVGVLGSSSITGSYYTYNSGRYYYCETTGEGWGIGDLPSQFEGVSAHIYPIDLNSQYVPTNWSNGGSNSTAPDLSGITLVAALGVIFVIVALGLFFSRSKQSPKPSSTPTSPPPIPMAIFGEKKFCRYCGAENAMDAVFCEKCGKRTG